VAKTYVVTWTIELDAEDPVDAARQAWASMQDPGSNANFFVVHDPVTGLNTDVDLEAEDADGEEDEDGDL
jgi:hypothetical protein